MTTYPLKLETLLSQRRSAIAQSHPDPAQDADELDMLAMRVEAIQERLGLAEIVVRGKRIEIVYARE